MQHDLAWMIGGKVAGQGDPQRARHIAEQVVRKSASALGELHPDTLHAQLTLARQLGDLDAQDEALALAERVAADAARVHGANHPTTFSALFEVAVWTVETAGPEAGARQFAGLLAHLETLQQVSLALVADCRWNLGGALLDSGETTRATEVLAAAVADAEHAFGRHHRRTFDIRVSYIDAVGAAGDTTKAATLAAELAVDSAHRWGEHNPTTQDAVALARRWP
jgi:hypothetical protein